MTVLFTRQIDGPAMHAFVVGVGNFPYAAQGQTPALFNVPNVPSAADSAKLMCDWLLANRDNLVAPLASIEVLISDPPAAPGRYPWKPEVPIDTATPANVKIAGKRWLKNFPAGSKNIAYFYGCGHGASLTSEPVLFLEELNLDDGNPWTHIHAASLARALRMHANVDGAFVFIDACGEKVAAFELVGSEFRQPTVFYPAPTFGASAQNKVMLMSAAPEGQLAYDAPLSAHDYQAPYAGVPIGRFTQTLIKALNGAAVREWRGKWTVNSAGLQYDLKKLQQFYFPEMTGYPFEPTPIYGFNDVRQFVYPHKPVVPVLATTNPTEMIDKYEFCICDAPPPPPPTKGTKHDPVRMVWRQEVPPRNTSVYAVAYNHQDCFANSFTPNQPQFDLQVDIP